MSTLRKSLSLLTPKEIRSGLLALCLDVVRSIVDMLGVASIVPFLSVLGNPEFITTNKYASAVYEALGFTSVDGFLIALGVCVIVLLIGTSALRGAATYATNRWMSMRGHSLARRLLEGYMRQPYVFFLDRHNAHLSTHLLSETQRVVNSAYRPLADLISAGLTLVLIVSLLLWVEPVVTVLAVVVLGGIYSLVFLTLRPRIRRLADATMKSNIMRITLSWEALSGMKQLQLLGRERNYLEQFCKPSLDYARATTGANTLKQVPRFALEALAYSGIVTLTLVLVARSGGASAAAFGEVLPVLGLFAVAGYRLMPALQSIYSALATLRIGAPAVDVVSEGLRLAEAARRLPTRQPAPLGLHEELEVGGVTFTYPGAEAPSLVNASFKIRRGTRLGIVGPTGSGKSTLTDLLLGLLEPDAGEILVDGVPLTRDNVRAWRATVGYVPQEVYITAGDVTENIAMGVPPEEVSQERLLAATRLAQIQSFILDELPKGFQTYVGEDGVKLSGGQRQRLGIARALYTEPDVIVFDEATSALDNLTERQLMAEIDALSGEKTIIMVAHRLSTVRDCDTIVVLDKGRIVGAGSYDELNTHNIQFRRISQAGGG
jgi:ABC-type multidrug transport system fused ATPase/permease subunit